MGATKTKMLRASAGFGQAGGLVGVAGPLQRAAVTVGFGWLTLLAIHLLAISGRKGKGA